MVQLLILRDLRLDLLPVLFGRLELTAELLDCSLVDLSGARAVGAIYHGAAVLVISEQVLEEIIEYSDRGRRCEVGGFLLGGVSGDKTPFVVNFGPARTDGLADVSLNAASFDTKTVLAFDELGTPHAYDEDTGVLTAMNAGTVTLQCGAFQITITVEPYSGELRVN